MKYIQCNYHGTEDTGNPLVNLEQVVYILNPDNEDFISFHFGDDKAILWNFENRATRDKEYVRVLDVIKPV